ncbi:MAG: hypothetical protein Q8S18_10395 [Bacteroidales bacterium]|nr:hypothetical protein [Bacteroidales bacterium]
MTGLYISLLFVIWYALSLYVSEQFSKKSKLGKQWLFFISFVFSPVLAYIVAILTKKQHPTE